MMKNTLITSVAVALSCSAAHAGENKFTRQEGAGLLTGSVAGAIVGGPIGAAIGLLVGGIVGDGVGAVQRAERRAQQVEAELVDARLALAQASERAGGEAMLAALAERLHADLMFRTASVELDPQVADELVSLGALLAVHTQLQVQLHGFADPRGSAEKNLELSLRRADAVREVLIKGGAAPEQIQLTAHGEDLTTATKGDVEAYAWERRVSLAIRPNAGKTADTQGQVAQTK